MTQKPTTTAFPIRRFRYYYDGRGRVVGRRAQSANVVSLSDNLDTLQWQTETNPSLLASDGLPADTTFAWDMVSDQLIAVFNTNPPQSDPNAGLMRQIIHGGLTYDDPIEVTMPAGSALNRLYPVFDEAAAGSLQAVLNADAQLVARNLPDDPAGSEDVSFAGATIDRASIHATKDASGNLQSIDVTIHATEPLEPATLATGLRLASVNTNGVAVKTFAGSAQAVSGDAYSAKFTLSPTDWSTLNDPAAQALSIGVTPTLRAHGWASGLPILPPTEWARLNGIFTSPALPVEIRDSLSSIATFVAAIGNSGQNTTTIYNVPSLALIGSTGTGADATSALLTAKFQALPFSDPATGLVYARARWYSPETGTFLSGDPMAYKDSSNLYAFAAGDLVNGRDPTGNAVATTANGSFYVTNPKNGKRHLLPIKWVRENQLAAQDIVQYEGGLSADETKDWMYGHDLKYTHPYARPVVEKTLEKGDNWLMNGLIATGGLPPQNRQQEIVQGGLQIAGTAAMVVGGTYGNAGTVSAQPVFETSAGMQVGVNNFMEQNEKFRPTVTVYRVEGPANARVSIGPNGEVTISDGRGMLFLNFGDPIRAQQFFAKRLGQGMFGVSTKTFEVPRWFMLQLEQEAVPQAEGGEFPGAPQKVDPNQAPNQYGLRSPHVDRLRGVVVPGSGKDQ